MKAIINALIVTLTLLAGCAAFTPESSIRLGDKAAAPPTFWEILASLYEELPVTKEHAESVFLMQLGEDLKKNSRYGEHYIIRNLMLADGVSLSHINFWVGRRERFHPTHSAMRLDIMSGTTCITLDQVKDQYDTFQLPPEYGETPNSDYYNVPTRWGRIQFGYYSDPTDCLDSVMFIMHSKTKKQDEELYKRINPPLAASTVLAGGAASTFEFPPRLDEKGAAALTLWQAIDSLSKQVPLTKEKIESALSVQMNDKEGYDTQYFKYFFGDNLILADSVVISAIRHGSRKSNPAESWIALNGITGACFTQNQIEDRYGILEVVDLPVPDSSRFRFVYERRTSWGWMTFSFHAHPPYCLISASLGTD
jgi:outer membrane murein-binding lipoprotein Lpp